MSYLTSFTILVLTIALFQRVQVESNAAERFRNSQQAFYLAEGGLDQALTALQDTSDSNLITQTLGGGNYTYQIRTLSVELRPPATERLTQQIIATGRSQGSSEEITALLVEDREGFAGAYATGPIALVGKTGFDSSAAIRTAAGHVGSIQLGTGAVFSGPVSVGPPKKMDPFVRAGGSYGTFFDRNEPYAHVAGEPYQTAGILNLPGAYRAVFGLATLTRNPAAAPLNVTAWTEVGPPEDLLSARDLQTLQVWETFLRRTYESQGLDAETTEERIQAYEDNFTLTSFKPRCGAGLTVETDQSLTVSDGDPLDLSRSGDGTVILCQDSVALARGAQLTFTTPATIYLGRGYRQTTGSKLSGTGEISLVVPKWANAASSAIEVRGGYLDASIWAPNAAVTMYASNEWWIRHRFDSSVPAYPPDNLNPVRIVANSIYLENMCTERCPPQFTFARKDGGSSSSPSTSASGSAPTIRYWKPSRGTQATWIDPTPTSTSTSNKVCGQGKYATPC